MRIAIFHSFILIVIYLIYSDAGNLNFYTNYLRNVHVWVFISFSYATNPQISIFDSFPAGWTIPIVIYRQFRRKC